MEIVYILVIAANIFLGILQMTFGDYMSAITRFSFTIVLILWRKY